jgi:SAM-dependent methyltransferase
MKLNLGCGAIVPEGWINVDYSLGARLAKVPFFSILNRRIKLFNVDWDKRIFIYDLRKKFPWKDETATVVYSSHMLEHLTKEEGRTFIGECHRILRKGGIIRTVVPDLAHEIRKYLQGILRADDFVESLGVLYGNSRSRIKNRLAPFYQFPHKCTYDILTLLSIMREIGFDGKARGAFDSDIEDIEKIESKERVENAVIVEGRKL